MACPSAAGCAAITEVPLSSPGQASASERWRHRDRTGNIHLCCVGVKDGDKLTCPCQAPPRQQSLDPSAHCRLLSLSAVFDAWPCIHTTPVPSTCGDRRICHCRQQSDGQAADAAHPVAMLMTGVGQLIAGITATDKSIPPGQAWTTEPWLTMNGNVHKVCAVQASRT